MKTAVNSGKHRNNTRIVVRTLTVTVVDVAVIVVWRVVKLAR